MVLLDFHAEVLFDINKPKKIKLQQLPNLMTHFNNDNIAD